MTLHALMKNAIALIPNRGMLFHMNSDSEAERCALSSLCADRSEHFNSAEELDARIDRARLAFGKFNVPAAYPLRTIEVYDLLDVLNQKIRIYGSLINAVGSTPLDDAIVALGRAGLVSHGWRDTFVVTASGTQTKSIPVIAGSHAGAVHDSLQLTQEGRQYFDDLIDSPDAVRSLEWLDRQMRQAKQRDELHLNLLKLYVAQINQVSNGEMAALLRAILASGAGDGTPKESVSVSLEKMADYLKNEDMVSAREQMRNLRKHGFVSLDRERCLSDNGSNPRGIFYRVNRERILSLLSYTDYLDSLDILDETLREAGL